MVNGQYPRPPDLVDVPARAFDAASAMIPLQLQIRGWAGQVDVTDLATTPSVTEEDCFLGIDLGILCSEETFGPGNAEFRTLLQNEVFERMQRIMVQRRAGNATIFMGLIGPVSTPLPGAMRGHYLEGNLLMMSLPHGYAGVHRPITAVAHELNHALGRPHAGTDPACYPDSKQLGEPWPGSMRGHLDGIGLDTRPRSGAARGPYAIRAPGPVGSPTELYDLMSYCGGESNTWISVKGWRDLIAYRSPEPEALAAANLHAAQARGPLLRVTAAEDFTGSLFLTGTWPARGTARPADPATPYIIEARSADGAILASAPADASPVSEEPPG